jgi:sec-independent protein translocase protein TatB
VSLFDINGWEFVLLAVIAVVVLGPERLPEYAAKLRGLIKQVRAMADSARGQLREQMGPEFDDIDWQQFDPRQYDPRRIVREALLDDDDAEQDVKGQSGGSTYDPSRPTPFDTDAT